MLPLNMYSHVASLEQIDAARNFHDETSAKKKKKKKKNTHTLREGTDKFIMNHYQHAQLAVILKKFS